MKTFKPKTYPFWYRVDYLDEDALGSPNVMQIIARSYKWSFTQHHCRAMALYCATPMQFQMVNRYIEQTQFPMKTFQRKSSAKAYIEEQANR